MRQYVKTVAEQCPKFDLITTLRAVASVLKALLVITVSSQSSVIVRIHANTDDVLLQMAETSSVPVTTATLASTAIRKSTPASLTCARTVENVTRTPTTRQSACASTAGLGPVVKKTLTSVIKTAPTVHTVPVRTVASASTRKAATSASASQVSRENTVTTTSMIVHSILVATAEIASITVVKATGANVPAVFTAQNVKKRRMSVLETPVSTVVPVLTLSNHSSVNVRQVTAVQNVKIASTVVRALLV